MPRRDQTRIRLHLALEMTWHGRPLRRSVITIASRLRNILCRFSCPCSSMLSRRMAHTKRNKACSIALEITLLYDHLILIDGACTAIVSVHLNSMLLPRANHTCPSAPTIAAAHLCLAYPLAVSSSWPHNRSNQFYNALRRQDLLISFW
jgi:hypothetical protein